MKGRCVIELINRKGEKGLLVEKKDGIAIVTGGFNPDVTVFDDRESATKFLILKRKKLKKKYGVQSSVKSLDELIKEGVSGISSTENKDYWYLINKDGERLFYDTEKEEYYFDSKEVGFVVFDDEEIFKQFIQEQGFKDVVIIKLTDEGDEDSKGELGDGKYDSLIGVRIYLVVDGKTLNSFLLTSILPTLKTLEGRGRLYKCGTDWKDKNIKGAEPSLDYDSQTLDDLLNDKKAVCPFPPFYDRMVYEIKNEN